MNGGLETPSLILRRFTAADGQRLFDLDADPAVMRYISGGPGTPIEVIEREVLPRFLRSYGASKGFGVWAALEKASGEFVGWFSLRRSAGPRRPEARLGYRLRRASWGRGYAREGARALVHRAFAELGVERLVATTYVDNLASRRVLEKAGMTLARRFRPTADELADALTPAAPSQPVWEGDELEYAVERSAWEARQQRGPDHPPPQSSPPSSPASLCPSPTS